MAFSAWDLGACNCGGCNVTVFGCNSLPLPGALVQVYDHAGGTLLDSGTTGPSGTVALAPATTPGYSVVSCTRFNTRSAAGNPCGATIPLSPAPHFYCFANCPIPLPNDISGTVTGIPGVGAITLDYEGTGAGIEWGWFMPLGGGDSWSVSLGPDGTASVEHQLVGVCNYTVHSWTCTPSFHWNGTATCDWISSTLDVTE